MDDADDLPKQETDLMPSEAALLDMMEQSDHDVAAGRVFPLADVLAELDNIADQMEARRAALNA